MGVYIPLVLCINSRRHGRNQMREFKHHNKKYRVHASSLRTSSPYTKYVTMLDKNDAIYALHLDYTVLRSWLHHIVRKPSG